MVIDRLEILQKFLDGENIKVRSGVFSAGDMDKESVVVFKTVLKLSVLSTRVLRGIHLNQRSSIETPDFSISYANSTIVLSEILCES